MAMNLMPFDELNVIRNDIVQMRANGKSLKDRKRDVIDRIMEFLIVAYMDGCYQVNYDLDLQLEPDEDKMYEVINQEVDGRTYEDRISEYCDTDDIESIMRVADTEMHRTYNTGAFDTATTASDNGRPIGKRWRTREDDRVRDTHDYMNGQFRSGLNDYFYSSSGAMAQHPGGFGVPEEDCGCRCYVEYVYV